MDNVEADKARLLKLIRRDAFKTGEFTLASGATSNYYIDGRLLTLEDTVEFHNLVLETKLTKQEKRDLVAFLRCL